MICSIDITYCMKVCAHPSPSVHCSTCFVMSKFALSGPSASMSTRAWSPVRVSTTGTDIMVFRTLHNRACAAEVILSLLMTCHTMFYQMLFVGLIPISIAVDEWRMSSVLCNMWWMFDWDSFSHACVDALFEATAGFRVCILCCPQLLLCCPRAHLLSSSRICNCYLTSLNYFPATFSIDALKSTFVCAIDMPTAVCISSKRFFTTSCGRHWHLVSST